MTMNVADLRAGLQDDFPLPLRVVVVVVVLHPLAVYQNGNDSRPTQTDGNPICKYFSHLSAEINDDALRIGKNRRLPYRRIHRDFATPYPGDLISDFSSPHVAGTIPWERDGKYRWSDFSDARHVCAHLKVSRVCANCGKLTEQNILFKKHTHKRILNIIFY